MANTPVLNFEEVNSAGEQPHYNNRLETDRVSNANDDKLDAWAGLVTSSFCETFYVSGTFNDDLAQFYGGFRYNDGGPRHITAVTCLVRNSGSGGVTRVDVRKAAGGTLPVANYSIFSNNVFKCILSASAGVATVGRTTTFAPGSGTWAQGQLLGVVIDVAAGAAAGGTATDMASDLTVQVWWKPSGSYA